MKGAGNKARSERPTTLAGKVRDARYEGLTRIEFLLRGLEEGRLPHHMVRPWRLIRDRIIEPQRQRWQPRTASGRHVASILDDDVQARSGFNDLAKRRPMSLSVDRRGQPTVETGEPGKPETEIRRGLWLVWRYLFADRGWERLKRCERCRQWFVDPMRNKIARWCSPSCKNRGWTRERRRHSLRRHRHPIKKYLRLRGRRRGLRGRS